MWSEASNEVKHESCVSGMQVVDRYIDSPRKGTRSSVTTESPWYAMCRGKEHVLGGRGCTKGHVET